VEEQGIRQMFAAGLTLQSIAATLGAGTAKQVARSRWRPACGTESAGWSVPLS